MNDNSQQQLLLPLISVMTENGGTMRVRDAAEALADRIDLDPTIRQHSIRTPGGKKVRTWNRTVRWVLQLARLRRVAISHTPGVWSLTDAAREPLQNAVPGVIVIVYEDRAGAVLWAEAEAVEREIDHASLDLIFTSPPYPLTRKKTYGNLDEQRHVEWLIERAAAWKPLLRDTGSLFLNMGDVWLPGQPSMSLYQERLLIALVDQLGYHVAQKLYWRSASRLPAPAQWVTITRVRLRQTLENVYWLSKTPHPTANNRNVLVPYSARMRQVLKTGVNAGHRPSGHIVREGAFSVDNGGAIPETVIEANNSGIKKDYVAYCRARNLPVHPARFPEKLPEFAIELTTEQGDLVWDPFGGSLTTAVAAQRLGRRFLINERSRAYIDGGLTRLAATH